jgi:hypothetical protein
MKKWIWITVPAVAGGLGLVFLGGSVFAQNAGNNTAPTVNWTAMADYCRSIFTGNTTVADSDFTQMRSSCQNAAASGNLSPGGMMGAGGMMGNHSAGSGMMGW